MKTVVNLRHAQRQDRSDQHSHLSKRGVDQARRVGSRFEHFDLVVTSPLARAVETAIAMGFSVDLYEPLLCEFDMAVMREPEWDTGYGYSSWSDAYSSGRLVYEYVRQREPLIASWLESIPADGSLLIVSHGGVVEALTLALVKDADFRGLGDDPDYVEGIIAQVGEGGSCDLKPVRA